MIINKKISELNLWKEKWKFLLSLKYLINFFEGSEESNDEIVIFS